MLDLPCEVIEQILLRIPARSLLRLKLVCKQWRSLISDPNFATENANRASLDQSGVIFYQITSESVSVSESEDSSVLKSVDLNSLNSRNFDLDIFQTPVNSNILGSCRRLFLIHVDYLPTLELTTLVLWNPLFSKKYKILPQFIMDSSYLNRFTGFGYATSVDDYKVVRLGMKNSNCLTRRCYSELQVEIYSLKTDSWKIIPGVPRTNLAYNLATSWYGTHVRGSIYWIIYDSQEAIIAFDLITDKFKLLSSPCWKYDNYNYQSHFLEVQGCLGAYKDYQNTGVDTVIWILNEDENTEGSWTKSLRIPKYQMHTRVLSFLNKNEVLLLAVGDDEVENGGIEEYEKKDKLIIYDSACLMFRDIPNCQPVTSPVHIVETLVSPNCFEYS